MFKKLGFFLFLGWLLFIISDYIAEDDGATGPRMTHRQFLSLNFKRGKIDLPQGVATLNLPNGDTYLNSEDIEKSGYTPVNKSLGMLFSERPIKQDIKLDKDCPPHIDPDFCKKGSSEVIPDNNHCSWAINITYQEDGKVSDVDADTINYDELLKDMKADLEAANKIRLMMDITNDTETHTLLGWLVKPTYDKANHKLFWAKELRTNYGEIVNFNIRVLGRKGVLVLNADPSSCQFDTIKTEMQTILASIEFTPGNTYTEFNSSTDKTAKYDIAALVAGDEVAKLGWFFQLFRF